MAVTRHTHKMDLYVTASFHIYTIIIFASDTIYPTLYI